MKNLLKKLYQKNYLQRDELIHLLNGITPEDEKLLYRYALETRLQTYGHRLYLRALLEFSSHCGNSCKYCGLRKENQDAKRYRLSPLEILECCIKAYHLGYRTFVLQSGEDGFYSDDLLAELISRIKENCPGAAVTLSIGERSYASYVRLFEAGADRYLLRHETIDAQLYEKLHPGMSLENRIKCLKHLQKIGYQVGAGFIVGLPGQDSKILAEELLFLKELNPDMVGIGPLIPHPKTPLARMPAGSVRMTLIILALVRLLLPKTLIPITTALNTLDRLGWEKGLKAGANVLMPNLSPAPVRGKYEIYQGKSSTDVSSIREIEERIKNNGFEVDLSRGDSLKWIENQGG